MKIYFERSGGFMGRTISTVVDTDAIPAEKALKLLEIVDEVDFFDLTEGTGQTFETSGIGADELCYRVTVEVAGVQHTIETSETAAPNELQPLLEVLDHLTRQTG
ncbi:MAG: protealysin inhibitor emfourin [Chloroflexota bacterium]|jgi:hypothetical protein